MLREFRLTVVGSMIAMAFAGCGGGGGSGASFDLVKDIYDNTMTGGYQSVRNIVKDDTSTTLGTSCGFLTNDASNQQAADSKIFSLGGKVNSATAKEYCATVGSETGCFEKVDKAYIEDGRSPGVTTIKMILTGLVPNHETWISYSSTDNFAEIESATKNASITQGQNCAQPTTTQTADAINGAWTGYKLSYALTSKTGTSTTASLNCANQVCTITDGASTVAALPSFSNSGAWKTAVGASKFVGASISSDKSLLSMFVCNAPLDESRTFESCGFYSFKR